MPTPSDNAPQLSTTSIPDDISARATCPPEVERLSAWRDSSETSARAEHDAIDNAPSPVNATAHPVLMRSDDANSQATAADPMRVESGASGSSSMGAMAKPDEDSAAGRLSPPADPSSRSSRQPSSVTTSPSTASLLSYEFSNVRVCSTAESVYFMCGLLTPDSSSRITLPPSYVPEADSPGPSSRTARFTMSMSKLSTLIWLSHTFVATFAFKVCGFTLHGCANLI